MNSSTPASWNALMRSIDLVVAADQAGQGAAVGADALGAREHLVHLGLRVGATGDLGSALGVAEGLQILQLGGGLRLGLAGYHERGQAESQRRAIFVAARADPR